MLAIHPINAQLLSPARGRTPALLLPRLRRPAAAQNRSTTLAMQHLRQRLQATLTLQNRQQMRLPEKPFRHRNSWCSRVVGGGGVVVGGCGGGRGAADIVSVCVRAFVRA